MEESKTDNRRSTQRHVRRWHYRPFFQYAVGTLLVLTIILLFYHLAIFLHPFFEFISILFAPIAIALFLYYLLRPIVYFFERLNVPRWVTISCIYIFLIIAIIVFIAYIGPILTKQIEALANISVKTLENVKESSQFLLFRFFKVNLDYEIEQRLFSIAQQVTTYLSKNFVEFLSFLTRLTATLVVIPFILFYLLKDDHDFASAFLHRVPEDYALEIRKILHNLDTTLSNYIIGLVSVSSSVGILLLIGYLIIGLDYALFLSLIAIIFMTIPFLGPFLAASPAILVGFIQSPFMALKVAIVFIIVQQIEVNFLSPQIIGQRLNIHPLTIMLLLLVAGSLYGLPGLILATPLYAIAKVLIENLYKIYHWYHTYSGKRS
jgi:predicted PurR-regulated permease PerM